MSCKCPGTLSFQRDIPVRHDVDVFVAGGGPAGVAAALSASRQGADVFLAEAHSCFGGMGTAGLVPAFMQFSDGHNFVAAGIGEEIFERMQQYNPPILREKYQTAIHAESLKRLYDDLISESKMKFSLHTQLIAVDQEGEHVNHVICCGKSGIFAVRAKIFVDGTGDGDLAAWAGAPFEKGDQNGDMMPGTLCTTWANIDWSAKSGPDSRKLEDAFKDNVFTYEDRHLPGMWRIGERLGGGNIGHTFGVDGTDERSLTQALIWGRKLVKEYEKYYREYLKDGYNNMELVSTGSLLGLRETRRIMGDYLLCLDDFKNRATFEDEIGRYSYPVDIHPTRPEKGEFERFKDEWENLRYKAGESYGIPYRILTPQKLDNVLVAGRCISADRFLQGSIRVMPGCYITGQAAGIAAAMAASNGKSVHCQNVKELQDKLKKIGAYLPNYS